MNNLVNHIKACIEKKLDEGFEKFILFPFGDVGMQVQHILEMAYGIQPAYILDNQLCKYNPKIHGVSFLDGIECAEYCLILTCSPNSEIYMNLKQSIQKYFPVGNIAELSPKLERGGVDENCHTTIGKYSYGPICRNHPLIESIGAFCSFAIGTEVEGNHEMKYITTHPIIDAGPLFEDDVSTENDGKYEQYKGEPYYFEGITPKVEKATKIKRCTIGNDVWLGRNVIITNCANIGNGVIAGAGAVITKDVPDYAVVVGAPARIIRYRFLEEEIKCLNKIAWWNWTDEEIRMRYDDFYLPVTEFIQKYIN